MNSKERACEARRGSDQLALAARPPRVFLHHGRRLISGSSGIQYAQYNLGDVNIYSIMSIIGLVGSVIVYLCSRRW